MREDIINILSQYPNGVRQRVLADCLGIWTASPELVKTLHEMDKEGHITHIIHHDPANMDSYLLWRLTTPAEKREIIISKLEDISRQMGVIVQRQKAINESLDDIINQTNKYLSMYKK